MNINSRFHITLAILITAILLPIVSSARFISVDPKANKYPDISPYAYCSNNPLKFKDSNGQEQFKVIVDAYIPYSTVGPFLGDNRGPSLDPQRSSRMLQTATVETDPNIAQQPLLSSDAQTGVTVGIVPTSTGPVIVTGQESTDGMTTSASRTDANNGDNATVTMNGSASNPLVPFAPAIDYSFQITVVPGQSPTVNGTHDGFPAYTITVLNSDGKVVGTYQHTPKSAGEVRKLFPPQDVTVENGK